MDQAFVYKKIKKMKSLRNLSVIMSTLALTVFFMATVFGYIKISYTDRDFFAILMAVGMTAASFSLLVELFPDDDHKTIFVRKFSAIMFALALFLLIVFCCGEEIRLNAFGLVILISGAIAAGTRISAEVISTAIYFRSRKIA